MDLAIFPALEEVKAAFDEVKIHPLPIPADCQDGFLAAFWKRPSAYLDPEVRRSISAFAKLDHIEDGLEKLAAHLRNGIWEKQNRDILGQSELNAGYAIVTARIRKDAHLGE